MKKYKYILICPYFGKLPNNFQLWLESCKYNEDFLFHVFTDDRTQYVIPKNVFMNYVSFASFKEKVQNKFDFKISLEKPYKLCDFKAAYGYIFSDILDCEYWGYCDMDLIFGDLKKYLPNENYDKISHQGHFSLLKNNKECREAFKNINDKKYNYKNIFSSKVDFGFDEIGEYGINKILENKGFKIFDYEKNVADIHCKTEALNVTSGHGGKYSVNEGKRVFEFNNGKVYGYTLINDEIEKTEYAYIHFQKRKMSVIIDEKKMNKFVILHHSIQNKKNYDINKKFILDNQPKKKYNIKLNLKLKKRAILVRIKRKFFYKNK